MKGINIVRIIFPFFKCPGSNPQGGIQQLLKPINIYIAVRKNSTEDTELQKGNFYLKPKELHRTSLTGLKEMKNYIGEKELSLYQEMTKTDGHKNYCKVAIVHKTILWFLLIHADHKYVVMKCCQRSFFFFSFLNGWTKRVRCTRPSGPWAKQ